MFSENVSLKNQILISFTSVSLIAAGITLAICYGLLYSLGISAYNNADSIIINQTKDNAITIGEEVSSTIDQQLRVVAESISMVSALYSSLLLNFSNHSGQGISLLKPQNSFKEYNFFGDCKYPNCPDDYGILSSRSRLPFLPGFINGSIDHSSVYLYSSFFHSAIRNDSLWNETMRKYPIIQSIIDGMSFQDIDFKTMYQNGPNTTVMFYQSSQIEFNGEPNYFSVHRTYPGILKNDSSYDPPHRGWFTSAPIDSFNLYGPYKETFTKQLVVSLTSKKKSTSTEYTDLAFTFVSSAVLLIDDLSRIVNSVVYINEGFGALVTFGDNQVLVWGSRVDVYDESNSQFKKVSDFSPFLSDYNLNQKTIFDFTDENGTDWIVSTNPFFMVTDGSTGSTENSLVMIIFSKRALAEVPLVLLDSNIQSTTSSITMATAIIVGCTLGAVLLSLFLLISYITKPFEAMRRISEEVVKISTEEEEDKDYSRLVEAAFFNLNRTDEVGLLASDYFDILCLLHNKNIEKKSTPKYPLNPFYLPGINKDYKLTWSEFKSRLDEMKAQAIQSKVADNNLLFQSSEQSPDENSPSPQPQQDGDLDILGSLTRNYATDVGKTDHTVVEASEIELRGRDLLSIDSLGGVQPVDQHDDIEKGLKNMKIENITEKSNRNKTQFAMSSHLIKITDLEAGQQESLVILPAIEKKVGHLTSLKSQLFLLTGILFFGLLAAMVITFISLKNNGDSWMNESSQSLEAVEVQNLRAITQTKGMFVESYFQQLSLDLLVGAAYFTHLMRHNLTRLDWISAQEYLRSYSLDPMNPFSTPVNTSYNFSSYFAPLDADCQKVPGRCNVTYSANQTRLTSLLDVKMRSYFHSNNFVSFMQMGMQSNGLTRYWPYSKTSTNSHPSSCLISDTTLNFCQTKYQNSLCASGAYSHYPVYDARCRSWYGLAYRMADPTLVYFQYPRLSSNNEFVLTATIPIRSSNQPSSHFYGVLISNFLISTLSDSINSLKILGSGFSYIIDATNATHIILHPYAPTGCDFVSCAESFSNAVEYQAFYESVLLPIQSKDYQNVAEIYTKEGKMWRVMYSIIGIGSIQYALIATVPNSEVLKASDETQSSINSTLTTMLVVFSFTVVIFFFVLFYFSRKLVLSVIYPVNDLRNVIKLIKADDLSCQIPTNASSLDMKVLLEAFTRLLVALRFDSDTYTRGNPQVALEAYTEALHLFTATHNKRGIGSSLNNLGSVELSLGHYEAARQLFVKAIENAEEMIQDPPNGLDIRKLQRILSDRKGNLAVAYIEEDQFSKGFGILEPLLIEDKKNRYIKGCVVKQGILGHYYLKQKEIKSAERIFKSAFEFTLKRDEIFFDTDWNVEETLTAEQIALFNLALLEQVKQLSSKDIEQSLVDVLIRTEYMHLPTVVKTLRSLYSLFKAKREKKKAEEIERFASEYGIGLLAHESIEGTKGSVGKKMVVFAIDYSGSMSGTKIKSAVENLLSFFDKYVSPEDFVGVILFNNAVTKVFDVMCKQGNESSIRSHISNLTSPNQTTKLYDAMQLAYDEVEKKSQALGISGKWVVILTDGEDNGSIAKLDNILRTIRGSSAGLVVIGVGSDVEKQILTQITDASANGSFVFAKGDKSSIDEAFGQVATIIGSQVIMEDI